MNRSTWSPGVRCVLLAVALLLTPVLALAQATLAGVVKDTSGAVLPGVAVEASSPALIEKTRTVVTDATGQYQIVDLRPGAYAVTFTLAGFSTVKRDAVQVSGGGVIPVNAELRLGSIEETITVSAEAAVVDVQTSTRKQQVLSGETLEALPAARGFNNYLSLIPGIQQANPDPGSIATGSFNSRGGTGGEGTVQIEGLSVHGPTGLSGYRFDMNAAEVQVTISGGLGESDRGGPAFNIIPRSGGNNFAGTYFGNLAGDWSQGNNVDDELATLGFKPDSTLVQSWDTNLTVSGPIVRDRVWFYSNARSVVTNNRVPLYYANLNAGKENIWTYAADKSTEVRRIQADSILGARTTWQATPRNKVGFYLEYTSKCWNSSFAQDSDQCRAPGDGWTGAGVPIGPGSVNAPESGTVWDDRAKVMQGSYTLPLTSRVLVEAGAAQYTANWGDIVAGGALTSFIPVTEQTANDVTQVPRTNYVYHGFNATTSSDQSNWSFRGSMSYVTGSHNTKVGYQGGYMVNDPKTIVGNPLAYRVRLGQPNQLTMRAGTSQTDSRVQFNGLYIQDQWTRHRLTLQGAIRYDHIKSWFPEGSNGVLEANQFHPALTFPKSEGVTGYHDITPRMGMAYDLFGNQRTALKVSLGKYLEGAAVSGQYTVANPVSRLSLTVNRGWTDGNRDFVPDCNLMNPVANGECQAWSNLNFGNPGAATAIDPATMSGWGVRPWDWQFSAGVQQAIAPRISAEVTYSRRWWGNDFITDNRALTAADYQAVTLTAPLDAQLPGGGGYPVTFLVRNENQALGVTDSYYRKESDYGERTRYWQGVDLTLNARLRRGLVLQGGTSTGRSFTDSCAVETARFGAPQTIIDGQATCNNTVPFTTSIRALATYTVPKVGVLVSSTVRSQPGDSLSLNLQMTAAQFLAATGRPLRSGVTSQTVNVLQGGGLYGPRQNNLDVRVGKILRIGHTRTNVGVDVYNVTNSNTATDFEMTYDPVSPQWMTIRAITPPRFVRFNVQFDF